MTKDYDLNELVGGTVDSIREKFGDLSDTQLAGLTQLEHAGSARSTLLAAIEDETKRRAEEAKTDGAAEAAKVPGMFTQAQLDEKLNEQLRAHDQKIGTMFTQAQLDDALSQQKLQHDEAMKLAVAKATGQKAAAPKRLKVAEPLTIAADAEGPALVVLTGASTIVFVDDEDRPIDTLSPMPFGPSDYAPNGNGVKLQRDVDFPTTLAQREISGAFVTGEDGKPVGKARLVQPFSIGGGRSARLQVGGLSFDKE
jgi:hypothetical protein